MREVLGRCNQSISDQELLKCFERSLIDTDFAGNLIDHSIFILETKVFIEAFGEWHNCPWHILKLPIGRQVMKLRLWSIQQPKSPASLATVPLAETSRTWIRTYNIWGMDAISQAPTIGETRMG